MTFLPLSFFCKRSIPFSTLSIIISIEAGTRSSIFVLKQNSQSKDNLFLYLLIVAAKVLVSVSYDVGTFSHLWLSRRHKSSHTILHTDSLCGNQSILIYCLEKYCYNENDYTYFTKKNCILRKKYLAFHQVKEELWNLWDMLLGVLICLSRYTDITTRYTDITTRYTDITTRYTDITTL